jgi:hypothetical protein
VPFDHHMLTHSRYSHGDVPRFCAAVEEKRTSEPFTGCRFGGIESGGRGSRFARNLRTY